MIDIIIPAYNSHNTIIKTLDSIVKQVNKDDFYVYIINDCSKCNYHKEIDKYSNLLNIKELKLEKNSGPGVARQYGLDNSNNEYIVFIDSDDEFYENDSILKLYNAITNYNMTVGYIIDETEYGNYVSINEGCLHGKMYRRSFIKKNDIRFNTLRSHEDNAFNHLYMICANRINYIEDIVYNYKLNKNSITRTEDSVNSLKNYIESMTWLFHELEKRKFSKKEDAAVTAFSSITYCYYNYLLDRSNNYYIFKKMYFMKKFYKKYKKYLNDERKLLIFKNFDYPVIPEITIYDFIDRIDGE